MTQDHCLINPRGKVSGRDVPIEILFEGENKLLIFPEVLCSTQVVLKRPNLAKGTILLVGFVQSVDQGLYNYCSHTLWALPCQLDLGEKTGGGA